MTKGSIRKEMRGASLTQKRSHLMQKIVVGIEQWGVERIGANNCKIMIMIAGSAQRSIGLNTDKI